MAKEKIEKDTSERWLLTYADLMNLLLIFFIILYTMSKVDAAKYEQVSKSMRNAMGDSTSAEFFTPQSSGGGTSVLELEYNAPSPIMHSDVEEGQIDSLAGEVGKLIEKSGLAGNVKVNSSERGIAISFTAQYLFASGSADLEANAGPTIAHIGDLLKKLPGKHIRVEGHTDSDPIKTAKFLDNWDLSSARANNVLRFLVDKVGIQREMISATGYADTIPLVANDTMEHKQTNRRVDIVILRDAFAVGEPAKDAKNKADDEKEQNKDGSTQQHNTEQGNENTETKDNSHN